MTKIGHQRFWWMKHTFFVKSLKNFPDSGIFWKEGEMLHWHWGGMNAPDHDSLETDVLNVCLQFLLHTLALTCQKYWRGKIQILREQNVVTTDKCFCVSQILWARPGFPTPKFTPMGAQPKTLHLLATSL